MQSKRRRAAAILTKDKNAWPFNLADAKHRLRVRYNLAAPTRWLLAMTRHRPHQ